jgi:flagellar motor switch protein FliN
MASSPETIESPPAVGDPPARTGSGQTAGQATEAAPTRQRNEDDLHRILHLEVPVIVRLAERTLPLSQIISLTCGAIIEFVKSSDSPLDLMINNKCIGQGIAVKTEENFGLRVTRMGSVRERVQALAERASNSS